MFYVPDCPSKNKNFLTLINFNVNIHFQACLLFLTFIQYFEKLDWKIQ